MCLHTLACMHARTRAHANIHSAVHTHTLTHTHTVLQSWVCTYTHSIVARVQGVWLTATHVYVHTHSRTPHANKHTQGLDAAKAGALSFLDTLKHPVKADDRETLRMVARTSLRTKVRG